MNNIQSFCLIYIFISKTLAFNSPHSKIKTFSAAHHLNYGLHDAAFEELWKKRAVSEDEESPPTIFASTLNATIIGKTMISYGENQNIINCFQGLRYAEKKPKRFTPPRMLKAPYVENDPYYATHLPDKCSQHGIFTPNIPAGTEDCLFLSVYTPVLPNEENVYDELLPVMIFFHGGAFIWGDSSLYLPTRLLEEKVILVVPHWRLGSFGFFTTMDERAPGNIGLYDQQMSMRWVQKHIESFGGDKNKVTIFGQSAGSASVNYHLITPASNGLFQGVIGESGSALEHWSLDEDPLESSRALGDVLCPNISDRENIDLIYECLMELDEGEIAIGINTLSHLDRKNGLMGFRGAAPIIQNPNMNLTGWYDAEILIIKAPEDYYKDQDFNRNVSLMLGSNKNEGSFVFGIMLTSYIYLHNLTYNEDYIQEKMIPDLLQSFGIDDKTHSLSESLASHYLKDANRKNLESCTPGMIDLAGVLFEKAGAHETAKLHSYYKNSSANTYLYSFEFDNDETSFNWLFMGHVDEFPESYIKGVTHSDELLYIFDWPAAIDEPDEIQVKDRLVKLWTNFAKYRNPTPDEDESWKDMGIPKWPNYDITEENFIVMDNEFTVKQRYSNRWTIANDEARGIGIFTDGPLSTIKQSPFTADPSPSTAETCSIEELNNLQNERDAYLITMIVFIIAFFVAISLSIYFYIKLRKSN